MYLITNTSLKNSRYIEGVRIPSQQARLFKELKPITLTNIKQMANIKIQFIAESIPDKKTDTSNIDSTAVVSPSKQKFNKKHSEPSEGLKNVESAINDDTIAEDKN